MRGSLDYLSFVCIRVAVGSKDLKAVSLKEPINLLAKPSKCDRQPSQWPIARQVYQFAQLRLSINQLDSRRIVASDTLAHCLVSMSYRPSDKSRNASYAASNLFWSEATDEASKMVPSESVKELPNNPPSNHSHCDGQKSLNQLNGGATRTIDLRARVGSRLGIFLVVQTVQYCRKNSIKKIIQ